MKRIKKILSAFLCLCLIFGLIIPAAAEELSSVGSGGDAAVTGAEPELADTGTTYTMNVGQTKWIFLNFNEPRSSLNSAVWESNCPWEVEILEQESIGCQIRINEYISYTAIISCTYYYTQYDRDYKYHHFLKGYESYYIKVNEPEKYTLSFDPAGGSVSTSSTTVYSGSAWGSLPTPYRSGYIFQGWYTSGGDRVTSNTIATRSMTVYAQWLEDVIYTVKFNANGGTVSTASSRVHNGSSIGALPEPTRSGYAFDGWYTAASGGSRVYSSTTVTSDMTLYAHWADAVRITFDPTGGTVSPKYADIKKGAGIDSLPTPTKENYYFNGWYTAASGGTQVTYSTTFSAKTTIYAHWIPGIIIYFRPEGGKVSPETAVIKPGGSIGTLPEPKRSGYAFDGWYTAASGGDRVYSDTEFEFNTKIYAHWKEYIKITLDPNGGTISPGTVDVIANEAVGTLPEPSRSDYFFDGWYTKANSGDPITSSTVLAKSTVLYAHWIKGIRLTLNPSGGTVENKQVSVCPGRAAGSLPTALHEDYSFSCWVTPDGGRVDSNTVFYKDTELHVRWSTSAGNFNYLIEKNKATLTGYSGRASSIEIPDKVKGISVVAIGDGAFSNSNVITSVVIPEGVTKIGEKAFYDCTKLKSVTLPQSVEYIGEFAFSIVYEKDRQVYSLELPKNIKYLGGSALDNTSWYKKQADGPVYVGGIFYKYKGKCPGSVSIRQGTTMIAGRAFSYCTELKNVNIPDSVTDIDRFAFYNCSSLESLRLPRGMTKIGYKTFFGASLKSITLHENLREIGESAFEYCKFTSIDIPDGVTSIGYRAFYNCKEMKSVYIPESVTDIGAGAFGYYPGSYGEGDKVIDGFIVRGYEGSEAQRYADDRSFITFVSVGIKATKMSMGDVNCDGAVNNRDAMILDRFITNWKDYDRKLSGKRAADLNGDGSVSNRDAMILDRHIAGWSGYDKYITAFSLIGDVNNDGDSNNRDAIILDRYIAGWKGYKSMIVNLFAADINRDRTVTNRDATMLDRCVAGWPEYNKKYIVTV